MRHRSEVTLILAVTGFALVGVVGLRMMPHVGVAVDPQYIDIEPQPIENPNIGPTPQIIEVIEPVQATPTGVEWFQGFRQYCNHVDIDTRMRWQPAPGGAESEMYKAACYALAGRIDQARDVINALPQEQQYQAAGVVFNTGHPAADAGDELAAGPLMELVVEYWPNHYMALYHAGAAAYERGEMSLSKGYLERFLQEYSAEDGWRSSAKSMLGSM